MQVTHDKKLLIAIGRSRKATQWQNKEMLWSEFLDTGYLHPIFIRRNSSCNLVTISLYRGLGKRG